MMVMGGLDKIINAAVNILVAEAINYVLVEGHLVKVAETSEKVNYILMKRNGLKNQMRAVKRNGGSQLGLNISD